VVWGLSELAMSFQQALKRCGVALVVTWRLGLTKFGEVCFQQSSRADLRDCMPMKTLPRNWEQLKEVMNERTNE
jgi:hypothetical protein